MLFLDKKSYQVLNYLSQSNGYLTVTILANTLKMSERSVYYSLNVINEVLHKRGLGKIITKRGFGIILPLKSKEVILQQLLEVEENQLIYYSLEERLALIICYLYLSKNSVMVERISEITQVSVRTVNSDLKVLTKQLKEYFNLELVFKKNKGYTLSNDQFEVRKMVMFYLDTLNTLHTENLVKWDWFHGIELIENKLYAITKNSNMKMKDNIITNLAYILHYRKSDILYEYPNKDKITAMPLFSTVQEVFHDFSITEQLYIAVMLNTARLVDINDKVLEKDSIAFKYTAIANKMIELYKDIARVQFIDEQNLKKNIVQHMYYSHVSYEYGVLDVNTLKDQIKSEYNSIYLLTKLVCYKIKGDIAYPITDNEVAYFTLLFGSQLIGESSTKIKILLVSSHGISTTAMIKEELLKINSKIYFVGICAQNEVSEYEDMVDLIITTKPIKTKTKSIVVNPVLTQVDRLRLFSEVGESKMFSSRQGNHNKLFKEIIPYLKEGSELQVESIIKKYADPATGTLIENKEIEWIDILDETHFEVCYDKCSWEDSIAHTADILIQSQSITSEYKEKCIANVKENGPYNAFANNMFLAHASPENGVSQLSIAIRYFKDYINYPNDIKIKFVVVLATKDYKSHIKVFNQIVNLFTNTDLINRIETSKNPKDVFYEIIKNREV